MARGAARERRGAATTRSRGCTRCSCAPRASRSRDGAPTLPHLRGDELDDIANEAADDALMSVLRRLDDFRGASRFTTWAYKFALLEAAVKLRKRAWQGREVPLEPEAGRCSRAPASSRTPKREQSELLAAVAARRSTTC